MAGEKETQRWFGSRAVLAALIVLVAGLVASLTALLMNIAERKAEHRQPYTRLVEVTENDTDPAQ